jgi:hypothetical protein
MPSALIQTADALVAAMRPSQRDVFEGHKGGKIPTGRFYITHGGGEVSRAAVVEALMRNLIRRKHDFDGYWCLSDAC